jgi:two-component system NtrC family sensor kinase
MTASRGQTPPLPTRSFGQRHGRWAGTFRLLWAAAVLLPALLFAAGAVWSWRQVTAEAEARLSRTVQMLQEHALRAFETQETVLAAIDVASVGMTWEQIASSATLHNLLRSFERDAAALSGIGMVRPDGMMVAVATQYPFTPVDVSDREYVRHHAAPRPGPLVVSPRTGSVVGEVVVSRPRNLPVFAMSRKRRDAAGGYDGVIVTAFEPQYFSNFYSRVAESSGDVAVLVRLDGALLARAPPATDWGRRMSGSVLLDAGLVASRPMVVSTDSPVDGVRRLYAVHRLDDYPVAVAYGLNDKVLRAAWGRQASVLGVICLLTAGLLMLLTGHASRTTQRRLEAEAARADAESKLQQSRRLEALGLLVAGVAHDFRNTVQAVQAGARVVRRALADGQTTRADEVTGLIAEAAGRGAALTDRMLAFARREQSDSPEGGSSDPALVVREACELLRPTLGSRLRLVCNIAEGLPGRVRGERAELEAALINLAVNARDATEQGGAITIRAAPEAVAAGTPHPEGLAPGRYARIAVADTGAGMDAATLERATEAFFTTKPPGEGTGLGLATTRAFAEQAAGALRIESAPGEGTTVTLWLPEAVG